LVRVTPDAATRCRAQLRAAIVMTRPTAPILLSTDLVESQIDLALRVSVDSLLEGVQVIDRDWRYLYVNEAACRHGGRPEAELLGRTVMACYPGIEQTEVFRMLERVMVTRHSEKMLHQFTGRVGPAGWFEMRAQPVPDGI